MNYLIKLPDGKIANAWIVDVNTFKGGEILGPALRDASGVVERCEWIVMQNGRPVVDATLKAQILAKETAAVQDDADLLQLRKELKTMLDDFQAATTIPQMKPILVKVIKLIFLHFKV